MHRARLRSLVPFLLVIVLAAGATAASLAWLDNGNPVCTLTPSLQLVPGIIGRSNGAWIVWSDTRNGQEDIYHRRVDSLGVLGTEFLLALDDGFQNRPLGVPDGNNGAIVAWTDSRSGTYDIYADRISSSGFPQWVPGDGKPVVAATGHQRFHAIQADGLVSVSTEPGAYVAWQDDRSGTGDIYAQHLTTNGVLWPAEIAVCTATGAQANVVLASDGVTSSGNPTGLVLAWQDSRFTAPFGPDLYAQRLNRNGIAQWAANGVAVCTATGAQGSLAMVGIGQTYVMVWSDLRSSPARIYAQKLDVNGVAQWTANGVQVAPNPSGFQSTPAITHSSDGSVLIVWADTRGGASNSDIYAQRLDANGAPLWAAAGVPLCAAAGNQTAPIVTPSLNGAVMVAWLDNRYSSNTDLFAQRIFPNQTIQWPTNGIPVTTAGGVQSAPRMTSDGGHGAILAWQDERTTDADIYATRIAPHTVVDVATMGVKGFALALRSPNPARGEVRLALRLERAAPVSVEVFDPLGRRVARLLEGRREPGEVELTWRGHDAAGVACATGMYLVRARAGAEERTLKVALAR